MNKHADLDVHVVAGEVRLTSASTAECRRRLVDAGWTWSPEGWMQPGSDAAATPQRMPDALRTLDAAERPA